MATIPRFEHIGAAALCILFGAAAIPAFAWSANSVDWNPTAPHAVEHHSAETPRSDSVGVVSSLSAGALGLVPAAERGDTSAGLSGRLRIHLLAPGAVPAGVYKVPGGVHGQPFAFIGVVPFQEKRGAIIGGYRVGFWPAELHSVRTEAYDNPVGFVEVTAENVDTPVSEHLALGDFVTHDGAPLPKYIVLRTALLDKIELVLADLEMQGISTEHVQVLSGFRTPAHNFALGDASGRARESRHQYGDAIDMIIDSDGDGRMDDINHDGRVDVADVRVIESAVDRVERAHPELSGGLGLYREMGPSGPFAHIDVRGTRARWGTVDRPAYAMAAGGSYGSGRTPESSHCVAEGASAILCQGFRHTR